MKAARLPSRLALVTVTGLLALAGTARAATNPLDPSFGNGGIAIAPTTQHGAIFGLAQDQAGRIVAAGQTSEGNFALLRFLGGDGSLDASFNGGLVETELSIQSRANDVAIQQDGGILAAGSDLARGSPFGSFVLTRYDESGKLDRSFGKNGLVITHVSQDNGGAFALAIQPDGRIVVGGFGEPVGKRPTGILIRYLANGRIDRSFGSGGKVSFAPSGKSEAAITDVAVLPSGKILASGGMNDRLLLTKLLPSGRPDRSFGGDGRVTTDIGQPRTCACPIVSSLATRPGGGTVVAGNVGGNSAVSRYLPNGALDRSFGRKGVVPLRLGNFGAPRDVDLQENGQIDVVGYSESGSLKVFRYLPNGNPDRDFGAAGVFSQRIGKASQAYSALIQSDGKLVVGGRADQSGNPREHEFPLENTEFLLLRLLP